MEKVSAAKAAADLAHGAAREGVEEAAEGSADLGAAAAMGAAAEASEEKIG
jgi:hypothetical protein